MGVFSTILQAGLSRGHIPAKTQSARNWYREAAKNYGGRIRASGPNAGRVDYGRINETSFMRENQSQLATSVLPGNMYMYMYDPKHKDTLPFYDRFPLIFPIHIAKDRFWGINIHYLPLPMRAMLLDALYDLTNNKKFDETTKLKLSYQILNKAAKFKWFKPCVKCYLKSHMRSRPLYILPEQWDVAIFLPVERFSKANKSQVWADSKSKI